MKGEAMVVDPLNALEVTSAGRGGTCNSDGMCNNNGCLPLCLHLCDQKQQSAIRAQIPNIWKTGPFLPTLASASCE